MDAVSRLGDHQVVPDEHVAVDGPGAAQLVHPAGGAEVLGVERQPDLRPIHEPAARDDGRDELPTVELTGEVGARAVARRRRVGGRLRLPARGEGDERRRGWPRL